MRRRLRGDRGAVLIESAVVLPILMVLFLALADFALAELSDAAGSNAAREGARAGILHYDGAHVSGSANHTLIAAAVTEKLAGNVKGTPTVAVRCLNSDGSARGGGGSCSTVGGDAIDVGRDLIEVTVTWTRRGGITRFIGSTTRTDRAVMRIVGTPPSGSGSPSTCSFTAYSATPSSVVQVLGTIPDVTFAVTVNDAAACGTPLLTFPAEAGYAGPRTMALVSGNDFTFTVPSGQGTWSSGTKTVTASANGGSTTQAIGFVVNDPSVCLITAGSATPSTPTQTAGDLPQIVFSVTVSSNLACGTPTLTFPAAAEYPGPQTMTFVSGTDYTFTMPAGQGTWTPATYTVTANANGGASRDISLVVSDPATCSLSNLTISPGTASVKKTGQQEIQTTVTITVTRSSTSICAVPTVTVTPGNSGPSGSSTDLTTPKSMFNPGTTNACTGLTCEYVIASGTRNWMPAPSNRTVTVTASGSTVTGTLSLT